MSWIALPTFGCGTTPLAHDTSGSAAESVRPAADQIVVRMTHRHFAIFRTREKPYRAYNSSGPVCR